MTGTTRPARKSTAKAGLEHRPAALEANAVPLDRRCFHTSVTASWALVVKASASRAEDPEFDSRLRRGDYSESSHTSDFKIGTLVATLPGAMRPRVGAGTGLPGVSIL